MVKMICIYVTLYLNGFEFRRHFNGAIDIQSKYLPLTDVAVCSLGSAAIVGLLHFPAVRASEIYCFDDSAH